jgi:tetratricopeptide (TPR) repeat protein
MSRQSAAAAVPKPGVSTALHQLVGDPLKEAQDDDDGAELSMFEADVGRKEFSFGPNSEEVLAAVIAFAKALTRDGEQARACAVWRRAAETDTLLHGAQSEGALETLYCYAAALQQAGEVANAERSFALLTAHLRERYGPNHPATLRAAAGHALALQSAGRHAEATEAFEGLLRHREALASSSSSATDPAALSAMSGIANSLWRQGRLKDAEELHSRVVSGRTAVSVAFSLWHARFAHGVLQKQEAFALPCYVNPSAHGQVQVLGADAPDTVKSLHNLAAVLLAQGRFRESEDILR